MRHTPEEKARYAKILADMLNQKLTIQCITCGHTFLDMKFNEYFSLNINPQQSTKWYNQVVLHFCENPSHTIIGNTNQNGQRITNFTEQLTYQLAINNLPIEQLQQVALEKQTETENNPI